MKFPYPSLIRQMSGRSAEVQDGDGVLVIPPVLQPVYEMFSPLVSNRSPAPPVEDTSFQIQEFNRNGAGIAQTINFPVLAAGRWNCSIKHTHTFQGTTSLANGSFVSLVDPDGISALLSGFNYSTANQPATRDIELPLLLSRPGFFFQFTASSTIALDVMYTNCSIYLRRIF